MMKSRKFKALIIDTVFSVCVLMATWYLAPDQSERVIELLGLLQVPVLAYIAGVAYEDGAALKAGTHITQQAPGLYTEEE